MDIKVTKQPDGSFIAIDADTYDVAGLRRERLLRHLAGRLGTARDAGSRRLSPNSCATTSRTSRHKRASTMREILVPIVIEIAIVALGIIGGIVIVKEIM